MCSAQKSVFALLDLSFEDAINAKVDCRMHFLKNKLRKHLNIIVMQFVDLLTDFQRHAQ